MMQKDIDTLADMIVKKIKDEHHVFWVDPETHAAQHGFLAVLMQERQEKIARRKRIEEKIAGSVILSAVLLVISVLGASFVAWLNKQVEHPENGG